MAPIERITLFKVPKEEDRQRILEQYKVLAKTATKVSQALTHSPPPPPVHIHVNININLTRDISRTANHTSSPPPQAAPSTTPATKATTSP